MATLSFVLGSPLGAILIIWFVDFFMKLYYGANAELVVFGKRTNVVIQFARGILQGGNEAGVFFTVCMDPLIKWLQAKCMKQTNVLRAYADDLAFSLLSLYRSLRKILKAFKAIEKAAGITPNAN